MDRTAIETHNPKLENWLEKLADQDSIKLMNEHLNKESGVVRKLPPREYAQLHSF